MVGACGGGCNLSTVVCGQAWCTVLYRDRVPTGKGWDTQPWYPGHPVPYSWVFHSHMSVCVFVCVVFPLPITAVHRRSPGVCPTHSCPSLTVRGVAVIQTATWWRRGHNWLGQRFYRFQFQCPVWHNRCWRSTPSQVPQLPTFTTPQQLRQKWSFMPWLADDNFLLNLCDVVNVIIVKLLSVTALSSSDNWVFAEYSFPRQCIISIVSRYNHRFLLKTMVAAKFSCFLFNHRQHSHMELFTNHY